MFIDSISLDDNLIIIVVFMVEFVDNFGMGIIVEGVEEEE